MNKTEKTDQIAEIKELLNESTGVFLVDYSGVNVEDINNLRASFKKEDVKYKVFKNTLFEKALGEVEGYDKLKDLLVGMTGFAFSGENFVPVPKIIKKYHDDKEKFSLKGCYIDSTFYDGSKLKTLASMPSKEEIMSSIIGSVQNPASGIVGAINAVMRDLANVVDQIAKQKAA